MTLINPDSFTSVRATKKILSCVDKITQNTEFFFEMVSNLNFQTDECKCQVRRGKNTGEDNFIIIEHYLSIIVNNLQIY